MDNNTQLEEATMKIIAFSGKARSCAMNAIKLAKENSMDEAEKNIAEAKKAIEDAQNEHTLLLKMDAEGEISNTGIILTHAMDHYMIALFAIDMAEEIMDIYRKIS